MTEEPRDERVTEAMQGVTNGCMSIFGLIVLILFSVAGLVGGVAYLLNWIAG